MTVVTTAGHVDHGKSTLVKALTGTDPDRFEEERRRGMTIDLGFAHTALADGTVLSLVDVPGHVRFLGNMLAGVGAVGACLFVVDAGEGWKPQSEEHLRILQLLGVRHGVIAVTKVDAHDVDTIELQRLLIADRVAGTFLAEAPVVAVSAVRGDGLDELRGELAALVRRAADDGGDRARPRLWIDRVFTARGAGTVVTGTLTGGALRVDEMVDVRPGIGRARVRGLQHLGASVEVASPGTRVAVNLVGIEAETLGRGRALVRAEQWRPTKWFDAAFQVLDGLDHPLTRRGAYAAYLGTGEFPVKMRVLGASSLVPGESGLVRIHLARSVPVMVGDRFVVREWGRDETVGGGVIRDVAPVLPASKARPSGEVAQLVAERGAVRAADLRAWVGGDVEPTLGEWVLDPALHAALRGEVGAMIQRAGSAGVEIAALDEVRRLVLAELADVVIDNGRARRGEVRDALADHPLLERLRAGGLSPGDVGDVPRGEIRALVQRGLVVERDGICWHPAAIATAAQRAAALLAADPAGFTVSQLREALGVSRKFAVPLAAELDARGATRRRGDLRIAGPRLALEADR